MLQDWLTSAGHRKNIEECRFTAIAKPGDELTFKVEQVYEKRGIFKFNGTVSNGAGESLLAHPFHAKLTVNA